ncbi:MAG: ABC transporter substrate-binding protein, partial [Gammaproteobacteria bacterium]|nr:ABC transporter substrate-binding protein [Gammaproteobacteria bacterium]
MKDKFDKKSVPGEISFQDLDFEDKHLVEQAVRRGFSRREMLKLMMATGVTYAAANNIFSSGQIAMAQTPKKGGSVRMASNLHGPDDQLDPSLFTSTIDYTRGRATYNSLVQHANDLTPQPELAEEFMPNDDATEWTFKIRQGVSFHDGTPLTADDVVYSMSRHLGDESTSVIKSVLESVKEWKKTGEHEVKAIMATPNADLPTVLGIFQTKIIKNGTKGEGNGTGPFTLESFEPGVKSVHKRNENYWREGANLDAIEI